MLEVLELFRFPQKFISHYNLNSTPIYHHCYYLMQQVFKNDMFNAIFPFVDTVKYFLSNCLVCNKTCNVNQLEPTSLVSGISDIFYHFVSCRIKLRKFQIIDHKKKRLNLKAFL